MRAIGFVIAACLPAIGLAQGIAFGGGSGFSSNGRSSMDGSGRLTRGSVSIGNFKITTRSNGSTISGRLGPESSYRGHANLGQSFFTHTVMNTDNCVYFGYEVILQEGQPGTYVATFGKIGMSPLQAAASAGLGFNRPWTLRELALPPQQTVHDGDTISIDLFDDPVLGKISDDIYILNSRQAHALSMLSALPGGGLPPASINPANRATPTVEGMARDFSATDAEMRLTQPHITLNGVAESVGNQRTPNAVGGLVWFYLPDRGRYILSLAPRAELDFQKSGEVRGGSITFTLGGDAITLDCPTEIASGRAPYNLWVLRDPNWEPTAQSQKGQFAIGSVDIGELVKLKRP